MLLAARSFVHRRYEKVRIGPEPARQERVEKFLKVRADSAAPATAALSSWEKDLGQGRGVPRCLYCVRNMCGVLLSLRPHSLPCFRPSNQVG